MSGVTNKTELSNFNSFQGISEGTRVFDQVPQEIIRHIFSYLPFNSLLQCSLVCKHWKILKNEVLSNFLFIKKMEMKWEIFGKIDTPECDFTKLKEILERPCPFSKNEKIKIKDTHEAFVCPSHLNEKPFTLTNFINNYEENKLIKHKPKSWHSYLVCDEHGSVSIKKPYIFLISKIPLPDCENKKEEIIQQLKEYEGYRFPTIIEASIFTLFSFQFSQRTLPFTYCEETLSQENTYYPIYVGLEANNVQAQNLTKSQMKKKSFEDHCQLLKQAKNQLQFTIYEENLPDQEVIRLYPVLPL